MGEQAPKFDVHLEYLAHRRMTFPIWQLFESQHFMYEDFPKTTFVVNGQSEEMPVYEQRIFFPQ